MFGGIILLIKKSRIPLKEIILWGFFPSLIKRLFYRFKGYKIGKGVKIGFGSIIEGKNVEIADFVKIGFLTVLRARTIKIDRFVTIGSFCYMDTEKIEIGEDSTIREKVYIGGLSGPDSSFKLGERCIVMQNTYINPTMPITVGDDSGIGGDSLLFTHGSWLSQLEGYPVTFGSIKIGKKVWLPWRVFITPGVTIEDNVVVGANSLVTTNIPSKSLASGFPARIVCDKYPRTISPKRKENIFNDIILDFLEYMEYHNFSVRKKISASGNTNLFITKGKKASEVFILNKKVDKIHPRCADNLLLINCNNSNSNNIATKFCMTIDIHQKTRRDSSEIGETLTRFFSRYGVRFKRLD